MKAGTARKGGAGFFYMLHMKEESPAADELRAILFFWEGEGLFTGRRR